MFISNAYASDAAIAVVRFGGLWLPALVVFLILFFFLIRPKQKKINAQIQKIHEAKRGDEVLMTCGIYGKIKKMPTNDTIILEIAKGVEIKMKKCKIAEVL